MRMTRREALRAASVLGFVPLTSFAALARPLVIAHRGASAYLPEHTLEAQAMAVGQGADFIEYDIVLSRDGVPIVLHDITIDAVTDVTQRFPGRARSDGRNYAIDFDLDELRQLAVHERIDVATGAAVFANRFPPGRGSFAIATLAEAIALVQGLEVSTGRPIGIYPEIKRPAWHRAEGQDIGRIVLDQLARHGYGVPGDARLFLQCFDGSETHRLRHELDYAGPLVQLIGRNSWADAAGTDYAALLTDSGLERLAGTVDAIGPMIDLVIDANGRVTDLVGRAAVAGLAVHVFTLRADALPAWAADIAVLTERLAEAGVAGLFTDHPDLTLAALRRRAGP